MNRALAELEGGVGTNSARSSTPCVESHPNTARPTTPDTLPATDSDAYKLFYLPAMVAVYTARHQQMPKSDERLHRHVFGFGGRLGCEACREETEFLVAHQKKFL
jgi:hypothetical protein